MFLEESPATLAGFEDALHSGTEEIGIGKLEMGLSGRTASEERDDWFKESGVHRGRVRSNSH